MILSVPYSSIHSMLPGAAPELLLQKVAESEAHCQIPVGAQVKLCSGSAMVGMGQGGSRMGGCLGKEGRQNEGGMGGSWQH